MVISNLQVVGNSLKSLEVSEEKANQRVEEFKREMKTLTVRLKEAENRAESAEKHVKRLQKEVDRLEGTVPPFSPFVFIFLLFLFLDLFSNNKINNQMKKKKEKYLYKIHCTKKWPSGRIFPDANFISGFINVGLK